MTLELGGTTIQFWTIGYYHVTHKQMTHIQSQQSWMGSPWRGNMTCCVSVSGYKGHTLHRQTNWHANLTVWQQSSLRSGMLIPLPSGFFLPAAGLLTDKQPAFNLNTQTHLFFLICDNFRNYYLLQQSDLLWITFITIEKTVCIVSMYMRFQRYCYLLWK